MARFSRRKETKKSGGWGETVKTLVYALLIAGLFRTVLFQPFWIPSGSMKPTLLVGDYLFISKFSYGYASASCPTVFGVNLCPFIDGRLMASEPERGDVIVFKHPRSGEDYIKRLIGLPGDRVQMKAGRLWINGEELPVEPVGEFLDDSVAGCPAPRMLEGRQACPVQASLETLPNGVVHRILNYADGMSYDDTPEYLVPEGHYFFMGDNRDNSRDSREAQVTGGVGYVPYENLVGRADLIAVSASDSFWRVWSWRFGRSFTLVD